jgi:hypothetical protein
MEPSGSLEPAEVNAKLAGALVDAGGVTPITAEGDWFDT